MNRWITIGNVFELAGASISLANARPLNKHKYVYVSICIHVCMRVWMRAYIYIYREIYMYVCVYIYMHSYESCASKRQACGLPDPKSVARAL